MLLIQSWVVPGAEISAALREGGFRPTIIRVDFEPAMAAALSRSSYDVVVLDPVSTGFAPADVERLLCVHGVRAPLVVLESVGSLPAAIRAARAALRN